MVAGPGRPDHISDEVDGFRVGEVFSSQWRGKGVQAEIMLCFLLSCQILSENANESFAFVPGMGGAADGFLLHAIVWKSDSSFAWFFAYWLLERHWLL